MSEEDIRKTVAEYAHAARRAIEAGFDGVELHGANGYLIEQFLNPAANQRTDAYAGNTHEGRMRFALEVARATVEAIGAERVGIRLSPHGVFNGMEHEASLDDTFPLLAKHLGELGLVYMHLVDHSSMGAPTVPAELKASMRERFKGTVILSGGYDAARAEHDLEAGLGELVAFGRPFIANPHLIDKLANGQPLLEGDQTTFYTPGEAGYTDYPID